jgi:hypothetical protein
MIRSRAWVLLLALTLASVACNKAPKPQAPDEVYTAGPGAVGLDIIPAGIEGGAVRWLATYSDGTTTTKFEIEFNRATSANNSLMASGKGRLISVAGSDPTPLLDALKEALDARHRPKRAIKADELPFDYTVIGENQSHAIDGSFSGTPKGNWTATKLFLANDQAEVYFNFNPVIHKAEFSIKDRDYGDRLLAEFAKVF